MFAKSRKFSLYLWNCFLSLLLVVSLWAPASVRVASAQNTPQLQLFASNLSGPFGLAFDSSGNLFVANENGGGTPSYVSKISPGGTATVFAEGFTGVSGLAFNHAGILHVSDDTGQVFRINAAGNVTIWLSNTYAFANPNAIAFDSSDNLYVLSAGGFVSKFDAAGNLINLSLASGFDVPQGIVVDDNQGVLYISDAHGDIYQVDKITGEKQLWLSTGYDSNGGLTTDAQGNFYLSSPGGWKVIRINRLDKTITSCISRLDHPRGLVFDSSGSLYVTEYNPGTIYSTSGCGVSFPHMYAVFGRDYIATEHWIAGATLTLTVDNDTDPGNGYLYRLSQVATPMSDDPELGASQFKLWELAPAFDLLPGQYVSITDGTTTKATWIVDGTFDSVNVTDHTAHGTGPAGRDANVWLRTDTGDHNINIVTGPGASWLADFGANGFIFDYVYDSTIDIWDDDGDSTVFYGPHTPIIYVGPDRDYVYTRNWSIGVPVTLTVDNDTNPTNGYIYQETQDTIPLHEEPGVGFINFDLRQATPAFDLLPGQFVSVRSGTTSKSTQIADVTFDEINVQNDTATGTGPGGRQASVWLDTNTGQYTLDLGIDSNGNWVADFGAHGFHFDYIYHSTVDVWDAEGDGDSTVMNGPSTPAIGAHVRRNLIFGDRWPLGKPVTLTIDDPSNGSGVDYQEELIPTPAPWEPDETHIETYPVAFQIQPGFIVTMTNGESTKALTIAQVEVTSANVETNTVTGVAEGSTEIFVYLEDPWSNLFAQRSVTSSSTGDWLVNFTTADPNNSNNQAVNIRPGMSVGAVSLENDGDLTEDGFQILWVPSASIPVVFAISSPVDIGVPRATVGNISVLNTLNDSLFRLDQDGAILPLAATGYTVSPNGLVYTVTLRPGAQWSDGQPVTAQHFVDGILRVLDPNVGSDYGFILFPILNAQAFANGSITDRNLVGVKALDSQTLQFTLEQPAFHFSKILASPVMLPARQDVIDQYGEDWTSPAHFVSNGLYKLVEYDSGHILMEKNLQYNGPVAATFSQLGFAVIPDLADQVAAYKNGTVDVLLSTPVTAITADPILKNDLTVLPSPGVQYLEFTTQVTPTNNPVVRKALAAAIDRHVLIENILMAPWRVEATGVIPPELDGYQGSVVGYSYSPVQAQTFLTQAGYPGGVGFPALNLIATPNTAAILEEVKNQWETVLGITVNIHHVTYEERDSIRANCRNDSSTCTYNGYMAGWAIDYPDAYNIINDLFSPDSPYNHTQWDNPTYRQLIDLALSEPDPDQRISYLQQAETILVEQDAAMIPLYHYDGALVVRPGIYPYYSPTYFSNLAYWSDVDPAGDGMTADVIGPIGGTVATENNTVSAEVPPGALEEEVTLSVTDLGGNYQITTSQDEMNVLSSFSIQPHGLQFDQPVTLTFAWNDSNNDGNVDETDQSEADIFLVKDGEPITPACGANPNCDMSANKLSVQVLSLSRFEIVIPAPQLAGDVIPPLVSSINIAGPNPTSAATVNFIVTFSEPVTGVDPGDFTLMSTGVTGAAITTISGSGAVYTVAANTGAGNGAIRLDLFDNNSITDEAGNPLGGAAVGDGHFTNGQTYLIRKVPTFADGPLNYWAWNFVERLYAAGITGGCSTNPLKYCPEDTVTRAQMAVFLLRGIHTSSYTPPAIGAGSGFGDVPMDYWSGTWIKQLAAEGITTGCGNGNYCPEHPVTRAQMAVFLLRSKYGAGYTPPAVGAGTGFGDVPPGYWSAAWIKQLVTEGITSGCGNGNYCPENPVTRAQMAVFLVRTFSLP